MIGEDFEEDPNHPLIEREEVPLNLRNTFGGTVLGIWYHYKPLYVNPFTLAGYLLSPVEEVMEHSRTHTVVSGKSRQIVNLLVKRLCCKTMPTREEQVKEDAKIRSLFWGELRRFQNQMAPFNDPVMWADDRRFTMPHVWYMDYVSPFTIVLGNMGQYVLSLGLGIGNCERSWGIVKGVCTGRRSSLKTEQTERITTLKATYEVEKSRRKGNDQAKWSSFQFDDLDFQQLRLNEFGVDVEEVIGNEVKERVFLAFVEPWEKYCIGKKCPQSEILLKRKYGGLHIYDVDAGFVEMKVCSLELKYSKKKGHNCYCVLARKTQVDPDEPEEQPEELCIDRDFHFMARCFYKKNPGHHGVKLITEEAYHRKGEPEDEWMVEEWVENGGKFNAGKSKRKGRPDRESEAQKSKKSTSKSATKKGKGSRKSKSGASAAVASKASKSSSVGDKRKRAPDSPMRKETKAERRARLKQKRSMLV